MSDEEAHISIAELRGWLNDPITKQVMIAFQSKADRLLSMFTSSASIRSHSKEDLTYHAGYRDGLLELLNVSIDDMEIVKDEEVSSSRESFVNQDEADGG